MAQSDGKPDPKSSAAEFNAVNKDKPQVPLNKTPEDPASGGTNTANINEVKTTQTEKPKVGDAKPGAEDPAARRIFGKSTAAPVEEGQEPALRDASPGPASNLEQEIRQTKINGGTPERPRPQGASPEPIEQTRQPLEEISFEPSTTVVLAAPAYTRILRKGDELHWFVTFGKDEDHGIDCGFDENRARRITDMVNA